MNSSLWTADRATHLKVVVVAVVATTIVIAVGLHARTSDTGAVTARIETNGPALKAGKPTQISMRDQEGIR